VLSEAAIGNVGIDYSEQTWQTSSSPDARTAFSIGEDLLRVYVIDKVDRKNHFWAPPSPSSSTPPLVHQPVCVEEAVGRSEWLAIRREAHAKGQ